MSQSIQMTEEEFLASYAAAWKNVYKNHSASFYPPGIAELLPILMDLLFRPELDEKETT